jgi:hypothetical protein
MAPDPRKCAKCAGYGNTHEVGCHHYRQTVMDPCPQCARFRELEGVVIAMQSNPRWPLTELLDELANSADHLLDAHGCDDHGHELVRIRAKEARIKAERIRSALIKYLTE